MNFLYKSISVFLEQVSISLGFVNFAPKSWDWIYVSYIKDLEQFSKIQRGSFIKVPYINSFVCLSPVTHRVTLVVGGPTLYLSKFIQNLNSNCTILPEQKCT